MDRRLKNRFTFCLLHLLPKRGEKKMEGTSTIFALVVLTSFSTFLVQNSLVLAIELQLFASY